MFGLLLVALAWMGTEVGLDPLLALGLVVVAAYLVAFARSLTDALRDRPLAAERRRIVAAHPGPVLMAEGLTSARPMDGYRLGRLLATVADEERIAIIVVAIGEERMALYRRLGFTERAERAIGRDRKCLLLRLPPASGRPLNGSEPRRYGDQFDAGVAEPIRVRSGPYARRHPSGRAFGQ